jgi:hypothetical protein
LQDGEYGFEKEGFEEGDFGEVDADEANWGEAEDFGGAPLPGPDGEEADDTSKYS